MSGIAGIYNIDGAPVDRALLQRMTDAIAHRGPDGIHRWVDGPVGMGHCVLQTTPESVYEQQPLTDESGNLCLTMDGRVDNREELISTLTSKGARLRDDTDAELVLKAYECWGEDCPVHILGDFAFVIWDKRQQQLFCVRDILGVRPFYYYTDGRKFLWASELHQLFQDTSVPREPNEGMVAEYLAASLTDREETLYKGIMRLAPAHSLLLRSGRTDKHCCYWDVDPCKEVRHSTDEEYAEHFSAVFADAVRCRLRSQKPVGAELSGGLDSSSVVGMARRLYREGRATDLGFATFSLVYPGLSCDESTYIDEVVKMWGVESIKVRHKVSAPSVYLEEVQRYEDFPDYPNGIMSHSVMSVAKQKDFRVLLTGSGGDDWFTGSYYHYADMLREWDIVSLIRQLWFDQQFRRSAKRVPAVIFPRGALLRVGLFPLLPDKIRRAVKWTIRRAYQPPASMDATFACRVKLSERLQQGNSLRKSATFAQKDIYAGLVSGWACQGNELVNRAEARIGLEKRHPFLDRRLVELAFALPERQRWRDDRTKVILRNAVRGLLPETIRLRNTKADFGPVFPGTIEAVGGAQFFGSLSIASIGWVNGLECGRLYREMTTRYEQFPMGLVPHTWKLWMICGIELWFRTVFLGAHESLADLFRTHAAQPQLV